MKIVPKKRRLEGKTNYTKRKRILDSGRARIIIRKSNRYITMQYVESRFAQDKVKNTITSKELLKYGWPEDKSGSLKSLAASYLTGFLFGQKIKEKTEGAILDSGLIRSTKGSKIYAAVKGLVDAGVDIAHNTKVFPEEKRINTEKTKSFFESVKAKILSGSKK